MARGTVGLGLFGLAIVFAVVIYAIPYLKRWRPSVSGFEDMSCEQGRKPCPEGYFCEQRTCVPILPRYNIDQVIGQGS